MKRLDLRDEALSDICRKWKIRELSLFGSVLGNDFRRDSDIDVLVEFYETAEWSLFDFIEIADELGKLLGHRVHLIEKEGLRNPFRRRAIMDSREVIYVA